jgi:DedD protein
MFLDGGRHTDFERIKIEIPDSPDDQFSSSIQPLEPPRMMNEPSNDEPIPDLSGEPDLPPAVIDEEVADILKPTPVVEEPIVSVPDEEAPPEEKQPDSQPDKSVKAVQPVPDKPKPQEAKQTPDKVVAKTTAAKTAPAVKSSQPNGPKAWVVQVGSFGSRENAVQLQNELRQKGFPGFVESFMKDGELSHRVRIGPEIYRADAEKIMLQIKDKMSLNGIVVSYP